MKYFLIDRKIDDSGVSGCGKVAEIAKFSDGVCALRWLVGEHKSTVLFDRLEDIEAVHGHNGHSILELIWSNESQE